MKVLHAGASAPRRTIAVVHDGATTIAVPTHAPCPAMPNPLHEQLLKAGLVKKSQVAAAAREQNKQRHGKATAPAPAGDPIDARRLQAERAEHDRALAEEQKAQLRQKEQRAQIRQIIETKKVVREGEIAYRFVDAGTMQTIYVNPALRAQLASGALLVVAHGEGFELLPRAAAEQIVARGGRVVLDHARTASSDDTDTHYAKFKVPDDLIW